MSSISPPVVRFRKDHFLVELGPDYSHLQEALLKHLQVLPHLADSIEPGHLILDMKEVKFIGSTFIGLLVSVSKRLKSRGGHFALLNTNKFCETVIELAGLSEFLPQHEVSESLVGV